MTISAMPTSSDAISTRRVASVSYWALGAHGLSFALGVLAVLIAQNFARGDTTTFTTASLISFLFGIALSAASTVLAIAAISLGKASEHVMIERSDASIRLQNEVFTKTTEALARIESSTGVTEKRIEDIISGRAGELSHAIAERLGESPSAKGRSREVLEQEIKESLIGQLSESRAQERIEARKSAAEVEKRYRAFQSDLLVAVASSQAGKCEKAGDGHFTGEGPELFDSIVTVGSDRIGVSAFSTQHVAQFANFLSSAIKEIVSGRFSRVIIAVDGAISPEGRYRNTLRDTLAPLKPEIADKIELFDGAEKGATTKVVTRISDLSKRGSSDGVAAISVAAGTSNGSKGGG